MAQQKRTGIPLTIHVVNTSKGNFFGHVSKDGRIWQMAKVLNGPFWSVGTERITISRNDTLLAEAEVRYPRGDFSLTWTQGKDPFEGRSGLDAGNLEVGDIVCVIPGPPSGKRVAPLFDIMCWNHMTGATNGGEEPYIE